MAADRSVKMYRTFPDAYAARTGRSAAFVQFNHNEVRVLVERQVHILTPVHLRPRRQPDIEIHTKQTRPIGSEEQLVSVG
jgi:hypothetical protein